METKNSDCIRILVVEDEREQRHALALRLALDRCYEAVRAASVDEGIHALHEAVPPIDLVVTDLRFGSSDLLGGLRLVEAAQALEARRVPVIVITAYGNKKAHAEAMNKGAAAFIEKGEGDDILEEGEAKELTFGLLRETIRRALEVRALRLRLEKLELAARVAADALNGVVKNLP